MRLLNDHQHTIMQIIYRYKRHKSSVFDNNISPFVLLIALFDICNEINIRTDQGNPFMRVQSMIILLFQVGEPESCPMTVEQTEQFLLNQK